MVAVCPHCGQPIASERLGVRLTPLKAAIVDVIKRHGDLGVTSESLIWVLYSDRNPVSLTTLKAHVFQINDMLAATDWVIESDRRRWFLRRRTNKGWAA
jgi:hypothetical protein